MVASFSVVAPVLGQGPGQARVVGAERVQGLVRGPEQARAVGAAQARAVVLALADNQRPAA